MNENLDPLANGSAETPVIRKQPIVVVAAAAALLGAALDFVFNGVFKIIYIAIYGPAYVVAASTLLTWVARTSWERYARTAAGALICGAVAAHFLAMGRTGVRVYPTILQGRSPLMFRSTQWPGQILIVSSDPLESKLAQGQLGQEVPVGAELATNYGCIQGFVISTVDGVDVKNDRSANWTWKSEPGAALTAGPAGPGTEDQAMIWCRFKPF